MDNNSIINSLSSRLGREPSDVAALIDGLSTTLRENLCNLNEVAMPGFGTFSAVKIDERIVTDESTGRSVLMPPSIETHFNVSAILRRRINEPDL